MKRVLFMLFLAALSMRMSAQIEYGATKYYPEGTRWTEIRLDTMKYDSWYTKVNGVWKPNYETVEYHVKGDYVQTYSDGPVKYKCVYTSGAEWTDSLTLLILENQYGVQVTVPLFYEHELMWYQGTAYIFDDWKPGLTLHYKDIISSNIASIPPQSYEDYGMINEISRGDFGGIRLLTYVDLNGTRIIQGIGVTAWDDGECLFGPVDPYSAIRQILQQSDFRHYRSMLVDFERDGEVLYDVWPQPGDMPDGIDQPLPASPQGEGVLYDLQGRRLSRRPVKGMYIEDGQVKVK